MKEKSYIRYIHHFSLFSVFNERAREHERKELHYVESPAHRATALGSDRVTSNPENSYKNKLMENFFLQLSSLIYLPYCVCVCKKNFRNERVESEIFEFARKHPKKPVFLKRIKNGHLHRKKSANHMGVKSDLHTCDPAQIHMHLKRQT